jgi:hypothetical protein
MSSKTDRFLAYLAQLFSYRGKSEAYGEQEEKSCLAKTCQNQRLYFLRGRGVSDINGRVERLLKPMNGKLVPSFMIETQELE